MVKLEQFSFSDDVQDFIHFLDSQKYFIALSFGIPNGRTGYGISVLNKIYNDYHAMKIIEKYRRIWEVSRLDAKQEIIEMLIQELGLEKD